MNPWVRIKFKHPFVKAMFDRGKDYEGIITTMAMYRWFFKDWINRCITEEEVDVVVRIACIQYEPGQETWDQYKERKLTERRYEH